MLIRRIPAFAQASIVLTVALASLASLTLLCAVQPAVAKPKKETCGEKHGSCVARCVRRYETTEEAFRCEQRTCDKQYDNCIKDSSGKAGLPIRPAIGPGGSGGKVSVSPKPTIGRGPLSPISGGLLDPVQGVPSQGPAAAGMPRAPTAPSAPPVIIR
jgi:hypothetical protein